MKYSLWMDASFQFRKVPMHSYYKLKYEKKFIWQFFIREPIKLYFCGE